MNCRKTKNLISAYLDQELTGREMLDLHAHVRQCPDCAQEWREISDIRHLLRALVPYSPPVGAESRLTYRLDRAGEPFWVTLASVFTERRTFLLPQRRGRRLINAMALSSLVIMAVAAPVAPRIGDAALNADTMTSVPSSGAALLPFPAINWGFGTHSLLHLDRFTFARSQPQATPAAPIYSANDAISLPDQTAADYVQGNVALADYRATASGIH